MLESIKAGHLGGVAIDAISDDNISGNVFKSPFQNLPNVILTPGNCASTVEATIRTITNVVSSIQAYVETGCTTGSINFPSVNGWKLEPGVSRILSIHRNTRGVLKVF